MFFQIAPCRFAAGKTRRYRMSVSDGILLSAQKYAKSVKGTPLKIPKFTWAKEVPCRSVCGTCSSKRESFAPLTRYTVLTCQSVPLNRSALCCNSLQGITSQGTPKERFNLSAPFNVAAAMQKQRVSDHLVPENDEKLTFSQTGDTQGACPWAALW